MRQPIIYLDYAATTPVDSRVLDFMLPYFSEHYGNAASRLHAFGWEAEELVENARQGIANKLSCREKEIIFTSGATESINLALKGIFGDFKGHLITVKTEHKATLDVAEFLESHGVSLTYLEVNSNGEINLDDLESAVTKHTRLVSILHVNNETGVIFPLAQVQEVCKSKGVLLHVDASQSLGKVPFPTEADLVSFSAHKIYGPKGVGVLVAKGPLDLKAQIHGGKQQRNRRSGTLNVPGIAGVYKAVDLIDLSESKRLENLRNGFERRIVESLKNVIINAVDVERVCSISNITFKGLDGEELLMRLHKIAASNGSACNTASTESSYVLRAMGLREESAYSSIRFSFGRFTTEKEMAMAADHVIKTVKNLCS